jgi:hypothetical protein
MVGDKNNNNKKLGRNRGIPKPSWVLASTKNQQIWIIFAACCSCANLATTVNNHIGCKLEEFA